MPIFLLFSGYMGIKNYHYFKTHAVTDKTLKSSVLARAGLVLPPAIMFTAGCINLWQAYQIVETYRQEKQIWTILKSEGVFDGKSREQMETIADNVYEQMQDPNFNSVRLGNYILS